VSPATAVPSAVRGAILAVGGGEDKLGDRVVLKHFVELAGGRDARIVVVPTASRVQDCGAQYEDLFQRLEAGSVRALPVQTRADAARPELLDTLADATGIFMTGGSQLRLGSTLGGTPLARTLRRAHAGGAIVAGTSAGAAFLSEHMIATGDNGAVSRSRGVTLAPGLGLTNRVVIDQHFSQRDRLGRLLAALAYNPFAVGIGVDEDTAAVIGADDVLHVVGSGGVTVVDPGHVNFTSVGRAGRNDPVCVLGLRLHLLVRGTTFNLETREASAGELVALHA
jgi:cyanophycinase